MALGKPGPRGNWSAISARAGGYTVIATGSRTPLARELILQPIVDLFPFPLRQVDELSIGAIIAGARPDTGGETFGEGEDAATYTFRPWPAPLDPVAVLKGCDCFDYQACETDDYEDSLAWTIVQAVRKRAINSLPGYDNADGWTFKRVAKAAR